MFFQDHRNTQGLQVRNLDQPQDAKIPFREKGNTSVEINGNTDIPQEFKTWKSVRPRKDLEGHDKANFRGVCNVISERKGAWFAFRSGRKISTPHLQQQCFHSLDPGEASSLKAVPCYGREVDDPTKISTRARGMPLGLQTLIKEIKSFWLYGHLTSPRLSQDTFREAENCLKESKGNVPETSI